MSRGFRIGIGILHLQYSQLWNFGTLWNKKKGADPLTPPIQSSYAPPPIQSPHTSPWLVIPPVEHGSTTNQKSMLSTHRDPNRKLGSPPQRAKHTAAQQLHSRPAPHRTAARACKSALAKERILAC